MVDVITYPGRGYDCNSFLIVDEKVVLIDTGTGSTQNLRDKVKNIGRTVDIVINTHAHFDHVGGNTFFDAEVGIHEKDVKELESGNLYSTSTLFGEKVRLKADRVLKDGHIIETGDLNLEVVHTPGHTPGSICILSSSGHLFSGDTLFSGGSFGRTDLPGGKTSDLLNSLERLKKKDFEFLMPGHMNCVDNGTAHLQAALSLFGEMYERV